jgi:hypothetical protein
LTSRHGPGPGSRMSRALRPRGTRSRVAAMASAAVYTRAVPLYAVSRRCRPRQVQTSAKATTGLTLRKDTATPCGRASSTPRRSFGRG